MRWVIFALTTGPRSMSMLTHSSESTLPRGPAVRDLVSQLCLADQSWGIQHNPLTRQSSSITHLLGTVDSLDPSRLVLKAKLTHLSELSCSMDRGPVVRAKKTHLTTETGFYILQAYFISLDSKWANLGKNNIFSSFDHNISILSRDMYPKMSIKLVSLMKLQKWGILKKKWV